MENTMESTVETTVEKKKTYLVIGGAGFIGSHIVDALVQKGEKVIVFDNLLTGKSSFIQHHLDNNTITFIQGDIKNKDTLIKACEGVDFILLQAARRSVPFSLKEPHEYNAVNIDGTLNVLEAAREAGVKRVVLASSSSVYGDVTEFPQKEEHPTEPLSPYALTKLAGEHYLKIFTKLYGLETVSLRYFNVFGPRQDPHSQYSAVIPLFIDAIHNNKQPTIFGDGLQSRDFTYIANVVEANLLACTAQGASGKVFNIADGFGITVLQLVEKINTLLGKDITPLFVPPRKGDVKKTLADSTRAKTVLGYSSPVSFDDGLKKTVDWFLQEFKRETKKEAGE